MYLYRDDLQPCIKWHTYSAAKLNNRRINAAHRGDYSVASSRTRGQLHYDAGRLNTGKVNLS